MHLSTYNVPRIISCAEITDDYLGLPRGCEDAVEEFFDDNAVTVSIEDKTNHGCDIDVCFKGTLKDEQEEAVRQLMMNDNGVLHATTAFGKTVTAIGLIARRKVNTLILVHNKALAKQWKEHLEEFLQINCFPKEEEHNRSRKKGFSPVGMLYTGENSLHGIVDIALLQSCVSDNEVKTFVRNYGMVIVDECHHVSAANFEQILKYVNARYVYGLTATPTRKDGHHPIIFMQCGAIRYTADAKAQMAKQNFWRALIPRFTSFRPLTDDKQSYPQILHDLSEDKLRNQLIISDVVGVLKEGRTPIIVSKLVEHVSALADMLKPFCRNIITMTGSAPTKEKREAEERLKTISKDEPLVIVASISYIGEGFDLPRLDTLFLALPVSYKNLVAQYTGRLHRNYEGKKEVRVYDYVDLHQPMCETMYKRRLRGYAAVGYKIENAINDNPQKDSLHIIYNSENFESTFLQDIDSAKSSIILSCPIIRIYHRHEIIDHLARASARGVNIQVFVHKCGYDEDKLKELGINVVMKDSLSLQCAVIDKSLYWYGDVNILGFHASDSSIIRMDDVEVAGRFLDIIYGEKGK